MALIKLKDGFEVCDYGAPYFIAELNTSHNGNIEQAMKMIDAAKESGCNCVKFQSWTTDSLYSKTYYDSNPIAKRMVKKFSMSEDSLSELASYCQKVGISFSSTPYSKEEVDLLVSLNVPFIKVASMDINNYPFLKYIAQKGIPIVLSTGMADIREIEKAVSTIENEGNKNLCILHCVSIYPAKPEAINLGNITLLRKKFPSYPIGYSDHTLGIEIPAAAVALGASVIEKHFTLDSSKMGWDNGMAMEPDQFKQLVKSCQSVNCAIGSEERVVSEEEMKQRINMRRSIVAKNDLLKGHIIEESDLDAKRPGNGLPPEMIDQLIGKTIIHNVEKDTVIKAEDIE